MKFVTYFILHAAFAVGMFGVSFAHADVFRCTQLDGKTVYQETPCGLGVQKALDDRDNKQREQVAQRRKQEELQLEQQKKADNQRWVKCTATRTCADLCFDAGAAMAKAYLSSFFQATEVGLMASDFMEKGCSQQVGDRGSDCVRQCKTGFKIEAKDAVKSLSR